MSTGEILVKNTIKKLQEIKTRFISRYILDSIKVADQIFYLVK